MSCLVGNSDCFKQNSILMLERSQELRLVSGGRIGKVCAGPCVLGKAIWGLRPATAREDCGSGTDELSLHCGKAVCTAASMLHRFILTQFTLGAPPNSPISQEEKWS